MLNIHPTNTETCHICLSSGMHPLEKAHLIEIVHCKRGRFPFLLCVLVNSYSCFQLIVLTTFSYSLDSDEVPLIAVNTGPGFSYSTLNLAGYLMGMVRAFAI